MQNVILLLPTQIRHLKLIALSLGALGLKSEVELGQISIIPTFEQCRPTNLDVKGL